MQGTQPLVVTKNSPAHKTNSLDEIGEDFQTPGRQVLYYAPNQQEAAIADIMIRHPPASLKITVWNFSEGGMMQAGRQDKTDQICKLETAPPV